MGEICSTGLHRVEDAPGFGKWNNKPPKSDKTSQINDDSQVVKQHKNQLLFNTSFRMIQSSPQWCGHPQLLCNRNGQGFHGFLGISVKWTKNSNHWVLVYPCFPSTMTAARQIRRRIPISMVTPDSAQTPGHRKDFTILTAPHTATLFVNCKREISVKPINKHHYETMTVIIMNHNSMSSWVRYMHMWILIHSKSWYLTNRSDF